MKDLSEYTEGQAVQVLINNPRTDKDEWRAGTVERKQTVHPNRGERHKPYTMLVVKTTRTYYKEGKFYNKKNVEGFVYDNQVKDKV